MTYKPWCFTLANNFELNQEYELCSIICNKTFSLKILFLGEEKGEEEGGEMWSVCKINDKKININFML